jgi:chromosomal replication initiation ATPase DnaA
MREPALNDVITITVRPWQRWLPQLLQAVADVAGVAVEKIAGPGQVKTFVTLRQIYVLAARDIMEKPYREISRSLGRADQTSARLCYLRARERFSDDREFQQLATLILAIAREITNREAPSIQIEPELAL